MPPRKGRDPRSGYSPIAAFAPRRDPIYLISRRFAPMVAAARAGMWCSGVLAWEDEMLQSARGVGAMAA